LRTRTWRTSRRGRAERRQERSQRGRLGRARADLRFSRSALLFSRSFRQRLTDLEPRLIALDPNQAGIKRKSKESGSISHERGPGSGRQRSRCRRRRSRDAVPRELRVLGRSRPEPLKAALWVRCRPDAQIPLELNFVVAGALRQRAWGDADVDCPIVEEPNDAFAPLEVLGQALQRGRRFCLDPHSPQPSPPALLVGARPSRLGRASERSGIPGSARVGACKAVHARSAMRRASLVTQTRLTASVHFPRARHASD